MRLPHSNQPVKPSARKGATTITAVTVTYSRSPAPRGAAGSSAGNGPAPSYPSDRWAALDGTTPEGGSAVDMVELRNMWGSLTSVPVARPG
ncbi:MULTISPECIES: hypothetical protein [Streptomyces]|uniref:hypothetical protein n=1 Tax=Streptomyces TaxID=1883 RepID=UPI001F0CD5F4|nr:MULTISPECIES: hypothetical protein [Streptomyces]